MKQSLFREKGGPRTFTANISVIVLALASASGMIAPAPALLTSISRRPQLGCSGDRSKRIQWFACISDEALYIYMVLGRIVEAGRAPSSDQDMSS
jgi:hypothetical protein